MRAVIETMEELAERFGLSQSYPEAVDHEVSALSSRNPTDDPVLVDRSGLAFVTIDDERSRDLDQALYVERDAIGRFILYYAVADASHYVRPGSALFDEALRRGASFYLPGTSYPMLPRPLSEGLVSLNEGVDRRALLFVVTIDPAGVVIESRFERARIRSRRKLSYLGVQAYCDRPEGHGLAGQSFTASLEAFFALGRVLLARAEARGAIGYREASIEVQLDDGTGTFRLVRDDRCDVERWNEQISLLCNIEGARYLLGPAPHVQPIFRVHPAPEEERVDQLVRTIREIVDRPGLDPAVWRWEPGRRSLSSYLTALPNNRLAKAIRRQTLIINQRSFFSIEASLHHGIGADAYGRFTSPMREIVGVFTHKETIEKLEGTASDPGSIARDTSLRDRVIEQGNRAKDLQRQLDKAANKLVIDRLLEGELAAPLPERTRFVGTIMGLVPGKIYVELDEPPIELKVYERDLPRGASAGLRIGDEIAVRVEDRDQKRDRWILDLVP
jgi:ribonuclease R